MTMLLLRLFVRDWENTTDAQVRQRYGTMASLTGIALNVFLSAVKFISGILASSISITADAFNNLSDAGSSIVTLVGFKMAGKPNDKEHPFGHGRIEYISGLIISFIIMMVGVELIKSSVNKIISPTETNLNKLSIVILVVSVLVKAWMWMFNRKLGKMISSSALMATSTDSINDSIATLAVIAGMVISHFTGLKLDGYIGLLVALFILYSGFETAKATLKPLLGTTPNSDFVKGIEDTVLAHEEVVGLHDLLVHDYGPGRTIISLHAEVRNDADIVKIHDIIDLIELELRQKFGCDATIHMDPLATDDEFTAQLHEKVDLIVKNLDERMSIHDFRVATGPTHTNLIFDVIVPFKFKFSDSQVAEIIKLEISNIDPNYFAVITVDKNYIG